NGVYLPSFEAGFNFLALDAVFHRGGWALRFEYAKVYQHAASIIGNNIHREGAYAQAAYRLCDTPWEILQNLEVAFRYSCARFRGIDSTALDLSVFDSSVDVPVNRNQYTIGLNYYFYPSMVLKCAYEFNREIGPVHLHVNVLMVQFAWGF